MNHNRKCAWLGGLALCLVSAGNPLRVWGQNDPRPEPGPDSIEIVPNARYRAGWLKRAVLGTHHRQLWSEPLKVERLDLDRFAGGLTPLCRAAGLQSPSLWLRGEDGRQYVFRSTDKDPAAGLLPRALHRTFVAYALQDQMSSRHPAAAVVVAPLVAATGGPHPAPELRVMPDDPRLGDFRRPFAGMLGTIEERSPADFEYTEAVWDLVEQSDRDRVDPEAYLEARLVDILVGDWERRHDRWTWVSHPAGGRRLWRPVPRDRDQAFARMDGVVLWAARYFVPQIQSFDPSYPSIFGLTWSARALDRRFLVSLEKPAWDSVVDAVRRRLTDSVLARAVDRLPAAMHGRHSAWLLNALRQRRDRLQEAADRFYPLVAEFADVHATDENDVLEVERLDDSLVRVRLWHAGGEAAEPPYLARAFHRKETKEVRVYLHGGDDRATVRGSARRGIALRIVGGAGDDTLVDSSVGTHAVTDFYDAEDAPAPARPRGGVAASEVTGACPEENPRPPPPRDLDNPPTDWGSRWYPVPWVGFQPNVGLLVGGGAVQYGYGFRKVPFAWRSSITAVFATAPRRFRVWYQGDFRNLPHDLWASLDVRYSGIDIVRFHGFGNETRLVAPPEFYRVSERQVSASASVTVLSERVRGSVGPFFGYTDTPPGQGNLLDSLRPYGSGYFTEVGVLGRLDVDTRDRRWAPRRGVHALIGARFVPATFDARSPYGSAHAEVATYLTPEAPAAPTLALRVGGMTVWGTAPFSAAAFLGGASTVRGYSEQRFAGNASVYGNAELRVFLRRLRILLPSELGVLGLGDVGRVFQRGETSRRWHAAGGAGLWIAFVERGSTVTLLAARSPEQWSYYASLGFMF